MATTSTPYTTSTPGVIPSSTSSTSSTSHSSHTSHTSHTSSRSPSSHHSSTSSHSPGSSSSASNASATSQTTGVSSGAAAGIGVGCAIAGAIIAALIVFFLARRKYRRPQVPEPRYQSAAKGPIIPPLDSEKGPQSEAATLTTTSGGGGGVVEEMLPPPSETKNIASDLSRLQILIRNHVKNFYSDKPMDAASLKAVIPQEALDEVVAGSPLSAEAWVNLLANTTSRITMIHYSLSWTILNRIQPSAEISRTLLPVTIVGCLQAMQGSSTNKDHDYLKSKWYAITAVLLKDKYVKRPFADDDDRNENLESTLEILDGVLRPLSKDGAETARNSNLEQILKFAAGFGLTLVSQPSSWSFNWKSPKKGTAVQSLVVFPTLLQDTDEDGRAVQRPREIGERETAQDVTLS